MFDISSQSMTIYEETLSTLISPRQVKPKQTNPQYFRHCRFYRFLSKIADLSYLPRTVTHSFCFPPHQPPRKNEDRVGIHIVHQFKANYNTLGYTLPQRLVAVKPCHYLVYVLYLYTLVSTSLFITHPVRRWSRRDAGFFVSFALGKAWKYVLH